MPQQTPWTAFSHSAQYPQEAPRARGRRLGSEPESAYHCGSLRAVPQRTGGAAMPPRPGGTPTESKPKLLDQMREVMRLKHLSYRTEKAYLSWVKRFILFHDKRHPKDMGAPEIRAFLSYLATHDNVAASTQNGALNALLFLYRSCPTTAVPRPGGPRTRQTSTPPPHRLDAGRSPGGAGTTQRDAGAHGAAPLWLRPAAHGMRTPTRQRRRFCLSTTHHP